LSYVLAHSFVIDYLLRLNSDFFVGFKTANGEFIVMPEDSDKYNRGGLMAFMFSMVFVLLFFLYLILIHPGVDLKEKVVDPMAPSISTETAPAFDISKVSEAWVSSPEMVEYGKGLFKTNCAMCHGDSGAGDGPAGQSLNPKPRNLIVGQWTQGGGLISHFKVLQNGIPNSSMSSYKHIKPADRWALVHFIESITENKSKDEAKQVSDFAKTAE
jgi:mono/diheme cytochrome c family protein